MIPLGFLIFMLFGVPVVYADIFDPQRQELTSAIAGPYHFRDENVQSKVSRRIDLDKSVEHEIRNTLRGYNSDTLRKMVNGSPMMVLQYGSPAHADLLKHFHTIAYLKLGMMYTDLRDLEKSSGGDLDILKDESEIECMKDKIGKGEFKTDFIGLMNSCRQGGAGVFAGLNYPDSRKEVNVFEKVLDHFNIRGEAKQALLEILPRWKISPKGYAIDGPVKRIGGLLADQRKEITEALNNMLKEYQREKTLTESDLQFFSMPGHIFKEQNVRDLLMLDDQDRQEASSNLIEQMALAKTIDQYDRAIEYLSRSLIHPSMEEGYKQIVRQGIGFLEYEKISLEDKRGQLNQYATAIRSLLDRSEAEKLNMIAEGEAAKKRKDFRENFAWMEHGQ